MCPYAVNKDGRLFCGPYVRSADVTQRLCTLCVLGNGNRYMAFEGIKNNEQLKLDIREDIIDEMK